MDTDIKKLIDRYHIVLAGDNLLQGSVPQGETRPVIMQILKEKKPEILEYLKRKVEHEQKIAKRAELALRNAYSVPGVQELSDARMQMAKWRSKFCYCMDHDKPLPDYPNVNLEELEQNKDAVFVLMLEQKRYSANYEIGTNADKCWDMFADNADIAEIRKKWNELNEAFVKEHIWD